MKKLLIFVLVLSLLCVPASFAGENGWSYDAVTKTLDISSPEGFEARSDWAKFTLENVVISGTVTHIPDEMFIDRQDILTLTVSAPVEVIGSRAFYNCQELGSISLGTALKRIGMSVFSGSCITHVEFPYGFERVGESSFYKCYELERVTFPETLKVIEPWAFYYCTSLDNVVLPASLEVIDFCGFYRCKALRQISIPNGIDIINGATFYECDRLKSVTLPDSVTYIDECAFEGCHDLEELDFPKNTEYISFSVFSRCPRLMCVGIPDSVNFIDSGAFSLTDTEVLFGKSDYLIGYAEENGITHSEEPEYKDVKKSDWFAVSTRYCFGRRIMTGTAKNVFSPAAPITYEMLCQIIAKTVNADLSPFTKDKWYSASVEWVKKKGLPISDGIMTRADMISALYSLFGSPEQSDENIESLDRFYDISELSETETNAFAWAFANRLICGTGDNKLAPNSPLTRAQASLIISNYILLTYSI